MKKINDSVEASVPLGDLRPKLAIFHANAKGTGCAITLDLHPAHGQKDGCIMVSFANQKTVGRREEGVITYPTFDWENRICVKLGFNDLCKMLQVFRGECESIDGDTGLIHRSPQYQTRISLRHQVEPVCGYSLDVFRSSRAPNGENRRSHILLTPSEALGLGLSFENSIGIICFGIPKVLPHDTAVYDAQVRKMCHGSGE